MVKNGLLKKKLDNTVLVLLLTKWEIFTEPYLKEKEEPKESSFLDNTDTDFKILQNVNFF